MKLADEHSIIALSSRHRAALAITETWSMAVARRRTLEISEFGRAPATLSDPLRIINLLKLIGETLNTSLSHIGGNDVELYVCIFRPRPFLLPRDPGETAITHALFLAFSYVIRACHAPFLTTMLCCHNDTLLTLTYSHTLGR